MKTKTVFNLAVFLSLVLAFGLSAEAYAKSASNRDMSADEQILLGGTDGSGLLPPTGSQAATGGFLPLATGQLGKGYESTKVLEALELEGMKGTGTTDHRAHIFDLDGSVKFRKGSSGSWQEAYKGAMIGEGYEVLTGASSHASLTFDANFANAAHIPENTKAEFRSIEPTDIFLADGRIYNMLDGLPKGSTWKVTTPTGVSAVRGTWYMVNFIAADGTQITATFNVPDDGVASSVEVGQILPNGTSPSITVPEGRQLSFTEGGVFDPSQVKGIDPKWLNEILEFLELLGEYRLLNGGTLPPTGDDFLNFVQEQQDADLRDPNFDTGATNPGEDPIEEPDPIEEEEEFEEERDPCEFLEDCGDGYGFFQG